MRRPPRGAAADYAELGLQPGKFAFARLAIGVGVARVAFRFLAGLRTVISDAQLAAEHVVAAHLDFGFGSAGRPSRIAVRFSISASREV